jgi:hypothetical protein
VTKKKADVPEWGEVWYNAKAITNIFSFAKMSGRYNKTTYDLDKGDVFLVHLSNNRVFCFEQLSNNLHA